MGAAERRQVPRLALLRFSGDISTKARATRAQFVRRLVRNLRDALVAEGIEPDLRVTRDRITARLPEGRGLEALSRVFGIQSVSLVERREVRTLDDVVREGAELFADLVRGRRFAVRARRVGNREHIAIGAREVERALGAVLLDESAGVDLANPEVTAHVEIVEGGCFLFPDVVAGCGGLPLGAEGRAVALLSGGFDSAVAAWLLMKRGVSLDYVFCNLGGAAHRQGAVAVAKVLADRWSYGDRPRLHAIDFEPVADALRRNTTRRYWQVLLKRLMLRAAERVARARRADALVTGEAVGQVSSQTLRNLSVISRATGETILRPLVGFNKEEIIAIAGRIGTYDLSRVVGEYCAMVPRRPATAADLHAVEEEEAKLDPALLEAAVEARHVYDLRSLDVDTLGEPEIEIDRVPEGAVVVDLRSKPEYETWHLEGALRLDFAHALEAFPSFDAARTYVLYCEYGLKSAHLAELMRGRGFDAHHLRGGAPALRKELAAAGRPS